MDPLLLSEASFCKYISESIDFFYETNRNDETSASVLWETLKAYIRGQIISRTAHANKLRRSRQKEIENSITNIDRLLTTNHSPDLYKERMTLKTELDLLQTREAEQLLLHMRGSTYEHGDKAARLLSRQLKAKTASNQIPQIRDETGSIVSDPNKINTIFKNFYSQLYTSEPTDNVTLLPSFFSRLKLPQITIENKHSLDTPLQLSEVKKVGNRRGPTGSQLNSTRNLQTA